MCLFVLFCFSFIFWFHDMMVGWVESVLGFSKLVVSVLSFAEVAEKNEKRRVSLGSLSGPFDDGGFQGCNEIL